MLFYNICLLKIKMQAEESFDYIKQVFDKKEPHLFFRLGLTEAKYMDAWLEPKNVSLLDDIMNFSEKHWLQCTGFFPPEKKEVEKF
jgi:hypothetical protein